MTISRSVSVALMASMLLAALPKTTWANEEVTPAATVDLRTAIDRAAAQSVMDSRTYISSPAPAPRPAARARQGGGGGGGTSMLIWTLVGTAASLGATYYLVKEMKKQTDEAAKQQ